MAELATGDPTGACGSHEALLGGLTTTATPTKDLHACAVFSALHPRTHFPADTLRMMVHP